MKKYSLLILSTVTAAILTGCGGGSSTSGTTSTIIPATKGPLLMATAVDSSLPPKNGTQISGTNKYEFEGTVKYPIIVTGGYIDANGNGIVDTGEKEFTGKLSSYTEVVTPITTYLGNPADTTYKEKLDKLVEISGATEDDITKNDPADLENYNSVVLALSGAIFNQFEAIMTKTSTEDDISDAVLSVDNEASFETRFETLKIIQGDDTLTNEKKLEKVENEITSFSSIVTELSNFDVKKINFTKESLVGKKLVVSSENEVYYFREDNVVLGSDLPEDYTEILSYGTLEDGSLRLNFESETEYDVITVTENDNEFTIKYYNDDNLSDTITLTFELINYTDEELNTALADVPFELTSEAISGKQFTLTEVNNEVTETIVANFYTDGTYFEEFTEGTVESQGECEGTWTIENNKLAITSTCSDDSTGEEATTYFTISETPTVGNELTYLDGDNSGTVTITAIGTAQVVSNDSSSSEDNSSNTSSGTLDSIVSGKSIIGSDGFGYIQANFYADGSYIEVGPEEDANENPTGNVYSCEGKWLDFGNGKIAATCNNDNSIPTGTPNESTGEIVYTLNSITKGTQVTIVDSEGTGFGYIMHVSDLSVNGFTSGSFVSGKTISGYDNYGEATLTFNADGTYSESGFDYGLDGETGGGDDESFSCTGNWKAFDNNKISVTCEEGGTTVQPDGIIDNGEMLILFSNDNPQDGDTVYIADSEEFFAVTLGSPSN